MAVRKKDGLDLNSQSTVNASKRNYYDEAMDWEVSRTLLIEKSERRAWYIAITLFVLLVFSWIGLFMVLPLKKDVPYMMLVDKLTGTYKPIEEYNPKNLSFNEVMDKYWLARFINSYESYSYYLLREDMRVVELLGMPEVVAPYHKMYTGERARHLEFKNKYRVEVEILSMLVRKDRTATVRIRLTQRDLATDTAVLVKNFISEIRYGYDSLNLTEEQRLINPLGFRVKEYRRVSDLQ